MTAISEFSLNGKYLAASDIKSTLIIWEVVSREIVSKCTLDCSISSFKWLTQGNSIVVIDENGNIVVWDDVVPARHISPTDMTRPKSQPAPIKKAKSPNSDSCLIDDEAELMSKGDDDDIGFSDGDADMKKSSNSVQSRKSNGQHDDDDMYDDLDGFIDDPEGEYAEERRFARPKFAKSMLYTIISTYSRSND